MRAAEAQSCNPLFAPYLPPSCPTKGLGSPELYHQDPHHLAHLTGSKLIMIPLLPQSSRPPRGTPGPTGAVYGHDASFLCFAPELRLFTAA